MSTSLDIPELFAAFEGEHPVDTYTTHDYHVWPVLRIELSQRLMRHFKTGQPGEPGPDLAVPPPAARRLKGYVQTLRDMVHAYVSERTNPSQEIGRACDVIMVTHSNRREYVAGRSYHTLADAFTEKLREQGLRTGTWEAGPASLPRARPAISITPRLAVAIKVARRRHPIDPAPEPSWFADVVNWCRNQTGETLVWAQVEAILRRIAYMRNITMRWLEQNGCRLVVLDCWYGLECMGASLAAERLGIETMELQHGLQGATHFGYTRWARVPPTGFALLPKTFWTWGERDAEALQADSGLPVTTRVGGHLWMNAWRHNPPPQFMSAIHDAGQLREGFSKVVLATLWGDFDELYSIIDQSPKEWLWLVRLHRLERDRAHAIAQTLRRTGHPGVRVQEAINEPLYALLSMIDAHVTRDSTCALEALAFGRPTLLLGPSILPLFAPFIASGVMRHARTTNEVIEGVKQCTTLAPADCIKASEPYFASPETSETATRELCDHVKESANHG